MTRMSKKVTLVHRPETDLPESIILKKPSTGLGTNASIFTVQEISLVNSTHERSPMPAGPAPAPFADTLAPPPVTDAAPSSSRVATHVEVSAEAPVPAGSNSSHASPTDFEIDELGLGE